MKKLIVWEKWVDPFDEHMDQKIDEDEDQYIEENIATNFHPSKNHFKVMMTPLGIMPLNLLSTSEIFNFWVGHTNFNLTKNIADTIEHSEGVETLDIITRYRFRIGIGKVFIDRDVMKQINDNVYEYIEKF